MNKFVFSGNMAISLLQHKLLEKLKIFLVQIFFIHIFNIIFLNDRQRWMSSPVKPEGPIWKTKKREMEWTNLGLYWPY